MSFITRVKKSLGKKLDATHPGLDLHSHLLPGIDDGVNTIEESLEIIKAYEDAGFKKLITTPHIMSDYFPNTPDIINTKRQTVIDACASNALSIKVETAAEYYIDDHFLRLIKSGSKLLTVGEKYVLVETSFQDKPLFLEEVIFELQSHGYSPILAHPERYNYLMRDEKLVEKLKNAGVYFQMNIISLGGFYSREVRKFSEQLIDQQLIDFVGSDCHSMRHFNAMMATIEKSKYWRKLMALPLKNDEFL